MPRSHIHGSPRRFHYGSKPTDDQGNDNFCSPIQMHNASITTYDYGCNTEIYGLIRIATDDAGSYPWLILRQIRECVTWALTKWIVCPTHLHFFLMISLCSKEEANLISVCNINLHHIASWDCKHVASWEA